jgi:hypothetical protein
MDPEALLMSRDTWKTGDRRGQATGPKGTRSALSYGGVGEVLGGAFQSGVPSH